MKLWGGRFEGEPDKEFASFNESFSFDWRLLNADIRGSLAHVLALRSAGILSEEEASQIRAGLTAILTDYSDLRSAPATGGWEDVHSFVESELVRRIGDPGYKLHTGRSRNDQVATDLRLFLRDEIDHTIDIIRGLQRALLDLADLYPDAVMPGYTHLQRAQPILLAHYILAYYQMFKRDRERLGEVRDRVNVLPLGAGALAGAGFPLDRELVARELGFDSVSANSLDAVSDRDFVLEFTGAAALAMMHLSRLSEDLILYSTTEFGFVHLSDAVSTGSSLMPQKKNPDSLELIRGKAGRVYGHHSGLLATMKGLPLAYNKDMQEDKEALFDTIDTLNGSLRVMTIVLGNITLNTERMQAAASVGFLNATDLADYLVSRGVEFRKAHDLVGRMVKLAASEGKSLEQLELKQYQQVSDLFDKDLFECLTLAASLGSKNVKGGTGPELVKESLARARSELEAAVGTSAEK